MAVDHLPLSKRASAIPLTPEGYPFIAGGFAISLVLLLLGWTLFLLVSLLGLLFVVQFFRDPERDVPPGKDLILSPADGRVIKVERLHDERFLGRDAQRVCIFMSPLNVHVNRIPCAGRIVDVRYKAGAYYRAYADNASLDNEQNAVVLEDEQGRRIAFVQIAGFVARRILCYVRPGMTVERGARYGMIRFGSRADIYLPLEAKVQVAAGDKAYGGKTVLAQW